MRQTEHQLLTSDFWTENASDILEKQEECMTHKAHTQFHCEQTGKEPVTNFKHVVYRAVYFLAPFVNEQEILESSLRLQKRRSSERG